VQGDESDRQRPARNPQEDPGNPRDGEHAAEDDQALGGVRDLLQEAGCPQRERGEQDVRQQPHHRESEHEAGRIHQQRERARLALVEQLGHGVEEEGHREAEDPRGGRAGGAFRQRRRDEGDDPEREHHADDVPEAGEKRAPEVIPAEAYLRARHRLRDQLEVAGPAGGHHQAEQETADDSKRTEGHGRGNQDDRVDRQRQSRRPGSDGAPRRLDRDLTIE
jgi:hypothetical protein